MRFMVIVKANKDSEASESVPYTSRRIRDPTAQNSQPNRPRQKMVPGHSHADVLQI
jgi:hypothetical protein